MKTLFEGTVVVVLLSLVQLFTPTESRGDWTPEFLSHTKKKGCILGNIQDDFTFLHGTDSGDFQKLGKVADMEVCVLLCCEMENCEAAFIADRNCYAVKCHNQEHCVTAPARKNKWHPSVVFVKRISQSKNDKERQYSHSQDEKSGEFKGHAKKGMSAVNKAVKNTEITEITENNEVESNGILNSIAIPVGSKSPGVRLDQEETKRKAMPLGLDKRKMAIREEMYKKSKYGLVSAAVLTCSMAVVLSGVAVIAARIRKKREISQEHEYGSVPTAEE